MVLHIIDGLLLWFLVSICVGLIVGRRLIHRGSTDQPDGTSLRNRLFGQFLIPSKSISRKLETVWPSSLLLWIGGGPLASFLGAEFLLEQEPHSLHWLTALGGKLAVYTVGWSWYTLRGENNYVVDG